MSRPAADDWKACPPGELGRLSAHLRSRRIRRYTTRSGISLAVLSLLAFGIWSLRPTSQDMMEFDFAGIKCSRVIALAPDYSMGKLQPPVRDQIKSHVEQCPRCHERFKAMGIASAPTRKPLRPGNYQVGQMVSRL